MDNSKRKKEAKKENLDSSNSGLVNREYYKVSSLYFRAKSFFFYWIKAKGSHSLHSPFLFRLYDRAFKTAKNARILEIENDRKVLFQSDRIIDVVDFKTRRNRRSTIGDVARSSLSSSKFSSLLKLLCDELEIKSVLETGTSLGINALYLSRGIHVKKVVSIEGSEIIHQLAKQTVSESTNVLLKQGDLYKVFEPTLVQHQPELIFLDADHRKSAIEFCLEKIIGHLTNCKCIVIHDIYWSPEMTEAWTEIVSSPNYPLTIDIFQAGIIFPNQQMKKQHFMLRF